MSSPIRLVLHAIVFVVCIVLPANASRSKRLAVSRLHWKNSLWPKGIVPILLHNYTDYETKVISAAIAEFHKHTCIKFVKRRAERTFVDVRKKWGLDKAECYAHVGRVFRVGRMPVATPVQLSNRCLRGHGSVGKVIHELTHAIGFYHEHERVDGPKHRKPSSEYELRRDAYHIGSYDPLSIMHYAEDGVSYGQIQGFSKMDVQKINALYNCSQKMSKQDTASPLRPRVYTLEDATLFSKTMPPAAIQNLMMKCPSIVPVFNYEKVKGNKSPKTRSSQRAILLGYCLQKKECGATIMFLVNSGRSTCYGFPKKTKRSKSF